MHAVYYDIGSNGELVHSLSAQSAAPNCGQLAVDNVTEVFVKGLIHVQSTGSSPVIAGPELIRFRFRWSSNVSLNDNAP